MTETFDHRRGASFEARLNGARGVPCSCASTAAAVGAALTGATLAPSCPVHEAEAIEAHRVAEATAAAEARFQRTTALMDRAAAGWAAADAATAQARSNADRDRRLAELDEQDPLAGALARAVDAPMTAPSPQRNSMPLTASGAAIAAAIGMTSADD